MILAAIQQTENTIKIVTNKQVFYKSGYLMNYTSENAIIKSRSGQIWMVNDKGRNVRMFPVAPSNKKYRSI